MFNVERHCRYLTDRMQNSARHTEITYASDRDELMKYIFDFWSSEIKI